jgi:hypothetical protein
VNGLGNKTTYNAKYVFGDKCPRSKKPMTNRWGLLKQEILSIENIDKITIQQGLNLKILSK